MVVSEIIERLSPNIAPESSEAAMRGISMPSNCTKPATMGVRVEIVPTEVPDENERKEARMKIPAYRNLGER